MTTGKPLAGSKEGLVGFAAVETLCLPPDMGDDGLFHHIFVNIITLYEGHYYDINIFLDNNVDS